MRCFKARDEKNFKFFDFIIWLNIIVLFTNIVFQISQGDFLTAIIRIVIISILFVFSTKPGYIILRKWFPKKLCCQLPYRFNGLIFIDGEKYFWIFIGLFTGFSFKYQLSRIKSCSYSSLENDSLMLQRDKWGPMYVQLYLFADEDRKEIESLFLGEHAIWKQE